MSDNIDYFKKYLKYKIKFLELKNSINLEGGKISKLKKILKLTSNNISRLTLKQTQKKLDGLYNYLLSLINNVDILINLKYEKDYYDFISLLVTIFDIIDKVESRKELINLNNLMILFFITQKTLISDLYNNNNYKHLIIPLIVSLINSQVYQDEIKIFLKYSINEDIIQILKKSNDKAIIDYLKK
jgi:hypothetical protein